MLITSLIWGLQSQRLINLLIFFLAGGQPLLRVGAGDLLPPPPPGGGGGGAGWRGRADRRAQQHPVRPQRPGSGPPPRPADVLASGLGHQQPGRGGAGLLLGQLQLTQRPLEATGGHWWSLAATCGHWPRRQHKLRCEGPQTISRPVRGWWSQLGGTPRRRDTTVKKI